VGIAIAELLERPNPARRHRAYPRAIKRARHNSYRLKRPTDQGITYPGPPVICIKHRQPAPTP
jgi:hypothetical protein